MHWGEANTEIQDASVFIGSRFEMHIGVPGLEGKGELVMAARIDLQRIEFDAEQAYGMLLLKHSDTNTTDLA